MYFFFRTDQNQALCITSASDEVGAKKLRMKFDKGDRYFEKEFFKYVEDPIIESAESGVASQIKVPKGIPAGGIKISVTGKNLAYIQKPQMYVYYEQKMFISVSYENIFTVTYLLDFYRNVQYKVTLV